MINEVDHGHTYGSASLCVTASATMLGTAWRMVQMHGFDATAIAALAGGTGTLVMAGVNLSREIRAWLDRREAKRADAREDARADKATIVRQAASIDAFEAREAHP
jgi:hypothetical protein